VVELIGRTEGWPVGLYLAALARQAGPPSGARFAFTGDDRFMADYLGSELLVQLPVELVQFLTRTAVLERRCGPLCDAVLDTKGSGQVLASLEDSNLLVVPLDRRREWYRYHQLFRELLLADLRRREPELVSVLHARAAAWHEANGLPRRRSIMPRPPGTPTGSPGWSRRSLSPPMPPAGPTPSAAGWPGSRTTG
jgi:LuxR family maltose regulon positive regulatory protein